MKWKSKNAQPGAARQRAIIYYMVALYIGYLGCSIMKNRLEGDDTMTYPIAIIVSSVLILGALWVLWYATKQMKNDNKQSENLITDKEEERE